jgi:ABC-2 type transport system permease protein
MLSLEGRQYWVIGLAPIRRSTLLWQKFVFCQVCALGITLPMMIFSNYVLQVSDLLFWRSIVTLVALSFGLTSLAIGLGAMTPNFREDNPARIANGVGGTMNIVLSLLYIGSVLALVSIPTYSQLSGRSGFWDVLEPWEPAFLSGFILVNGIAWFVPLSLGIRRWNRLEF